MPIDAHTIADQLLLGRYRVLEVRGQGGFGTVSVCWDPRLMRRVAIKSIPLHQAEPVVKPAKPKRKARQPFQGNADPAATPSGAPDLPLADAYLEQRRREMLLRAALAETRTASMLNHPGIVAMLDFEYDDDSAYIIMEYVEGASLAELLDATEDGLLTSDEAAAVVESVCDALQFAHDNGVLHLDIKPDNILIDMSGRIKLADFGMAVLAGATGHATARGGTVGYMPPEQIECADVDVRTDVFAFAAVMYEALTGVRPFAAPAMSQSLELVRAGAADPCALSETVSPQAADALLDALNPNPLARHASAEELAEDLLPGLGRPKAGRKSLASFVADVLDDSEPADPAAENPGAPAPHAPRELAGNPDLGPLSHALPSLAPRALALLGALAAGWLAASSTQVLASANGPTPALVAFAAALALGLAAPQLGSAVALVALAAACVSQGFWLHALAAAAAGAAWWALVARNLPRSSAPTLACSFTSPPANPAAPLVAAWLLPPGPAALSALLAFTVAACLSALHTAGATDAASTAAATLGGFTAWGTPLDPWRFWLTGAAWVAAAAATSALCHRAPKPRCYAGAVAGGASYTALMLVVTRMENGGSWATLPPELLLCAVGSTILVAMCVFMLGSPRALDVDGAEPMDDNG